MLKDFSKFEQLLVVLIVSLAIFDVAVYMGLIPVNPNASKVHLQNKEIKKATPVTEQNNSQLQEKPSKPSSAPELTQVHTETYDQSTPESLGNALVKAINNNDFNGYKALLHPASIKGLEQKNKKDFSKSIKRSIEDTIREVKNVKLKDISSNKYYDPSIPAFKMGPMLQVFPVNVEKVLTIEAVKENGKETVQIYFISRLKGKWYNIWPTEERMVKK
ncbi:MAG: hypothetical protein OEV42_19395 [Deltaproteobacteria bacterium]|nr:hypothetical protein [Deltaproteobacteria bacterium]